VRRALRLGDDELAAQQLETVLRSEHAQVDEAIVLRARPALGLERGHGGSVAKR
jgi:hypothetical protein